MSKTKTPAGNTEVIRVRIAKENAAAIRIAAAHEQRPFANMLNRILTEYFESK
jgi:predicted DNA binding CopG/RHH family protein